jgi:alkylated DNA nucleotide flippase Atl1
MSSDGQAPAFGNVRGIWSRIAGLAGGRQADCIAIQLGISQSLRAAPDKEIAMNRFERASQIWAVLAWAARNRQTLTYRQVAQLIGVPAAGLGQLLEPIQSYCLVKKLPPLTVLVVQQETGLPGSGFIGATASEYARAQAETFSKDWLEQGNPQPDQFESAVQERPSNGAQ